ncbi:MAG: hypothetical protein AAF690_04335 [Acidobacteriota bacterium]
MRSIAAAALLLFLGSTAAEARCQPAKWNLPLRFPIASFVLSVLVEEPVSPKESGGPTLRAKLHESVHVPEQSLFFDLAIHGSVDGCPSDRLSAEELGDRFARGDELLVVAYRGPDGTLETFLDWLAYASQLRRNPIDNAFDYLSALFRLETLESDTDRVQPLRSIALYMDDPEAYRSLLAVQLETKRLRRRMMKVYETLNEG